MNARGKLTASPPKLMAADAAVVDGFGDDQSPAGLAEAEADGGELPMGRPLSPRPPTGVVSLLHPAKKLAPAPRSLSSALSPRLSPRRVHHLPGIDSGGEGHTGKQARDAGLRRDEAALRGLTGTAVTNGLTGSPAAPRPPITIPTL